MNNFEAYKSDFCNGAHKTYGLLMIQECPKYLY